MLQSLLLTEYVGHPRARDALNKRSASQLRSCAYHCPPSAYRSGNRACTKACNDAICCCKSAKVGSPD